MEKYLILERDGTGEWQDYRVTFIARKGLEKNVAENLCASLNAAAKTEFYMVIAAPFVEEK